MMSIRLTVCTIACVCGFSSFSQIEGEIHQNAEPAFFRTYANYLRVNGQRRIEGYRVQVYNGNRREANEWRAKFIQTFPEMENMVVFETPDYKFQVGNYRTIYEAEAALVKIREAFPGAFIVETSINPPEIKTPEPVVEEVVPADGENSSRSDRISIENQRRENQENEN